MGAITEILDPVSLIPALWLWSGTGDDTRKRGICKAVKVHVRQKFEVSIEF